MNVRQHVNGILLLDKPIAHTSNQALQCVKHLFQAKKAGHTGSLDPIATGMLPICFGEATKFSQFLLESDKTYQVTAKLGIETTTGDSEGVIVKQQTEFVIDKNILNQVIEKFIGTIAQIPPMHSAIKVQGKPLYKLAHQGIEIERQPREITIFKLEVIDCRQDELDLLVHCSKGTYIRTLVQDIGRALQCYAHVIRLHRVSVSPYKEAPMYKLETLQAIKEQVGLARLHAFLLPLESAVDVFPAIKLSTAAAFYLQRGQAVRSSMHFNSRLVRLFSESDKFIGIGEVLPDGRIKPHRLIEEAHCK